MKKRILCVMLTVALLCSLTGHTYAAIAEPGIQPLYQYAADAYATLQINGTTATGTAVLDGFAGTTTKVNVVMTLQKKGLWWSNASDSFNYTTYGHDANLELNYDSLSSGTYRIKDVFTVYSGTASETITAYSPEARV